MAIPLAYLHKIYKERLLACIKDDLFEGVIQCIDFGIKPKDFLEIALCCAAENDKLDIFKYLSEKYPFAQVDWEKIISHISSIRIVDYILKSDIDFGVNLCEIFINKCNLEIVKHLLENIYISANEMRYLMRKSIFTSKLDVISILYEKYFEMYRYGIVWKYEHVYIPSKINTIEQLDIIYYINNCMNWNDYSTIYREATKLGHLSLLKKMESRFPSNFQSDAISRAGFASAAEYGHLDLVKYLFHRASIQCKKDAMQISIDKGHLEISIFLMENGIVPRYIYTRFYNSVRHGHVSVAKYLHKIDPTVHHSLSEKDIRKSCEKGPEVIYYLSDIGVSLDDFYKNIFIHCDLETLKYVHKRDNILDMDDTEFLKYLVKENYFDDLDVKTISIIKLKQLISANFKNFSEKDDYYLLVNGIVYEGSKYQRMQSEFEARKTYYSNLKTSLFTAAREITMRPGGLRMTLMEKEFGMDDKLRSEASRYMD